MNTHDAPLQGHIDGVYAPAGLTVEILEKLCPSASDLRDILLGRGEALCFDELESIGRGDLAEQLDGLNWRGARTFLDDEQLLSVLPGLIVRRLRDYVESSNEKTLVVLYQRLGRRATQTLRVIGDRFAVTSERVRQNEVSIASEIDVRAGPEASIVGACLRRKTPLASLAVADEIEHALDMMFGPGEEGSLAGLAGGLVRRRLGYDWISEGVAIHRSAEMGCKAIEKTLKGKAPGDVRMIHLDEMRKILPPDTDLDLVCKALGIDRVGESHATMRPTAKARVKAALLEIKKPVTRPQLSERTGLTLHKTGLQLSNLKNACKVDKDHWVYNSGDALIVPYQGIPSEIAREIEKRGGVASVQHIRKTFPHLYGVKASTVDAYLSTNQFMISDGKIRLASPSKVINERFLPLEEVASGRDKQGRIYWEFPASPKLFSGFSLTGVPMEFVHALGCEPNDNVKLSVDYPEGEHVLTVSWQLSSTSQGTIGHLAKPLKMLRERSRHPVDKNRLVRIVMCDPGHVELHLAPPNTQRKPRQRRPSISAA